MIHKALSTLNKGTVFKPSLYNRLQFKFMSLFCDGEQFLIKKVGTYDVIYLALIVLKGRLS